MPAIVQNGQLPQRVQLGQRRLFVRTIGKIHGYQLKVDICQRSEQPHLVAVAGWAQVIQFHCAPPLMS